MCGISGFAHADSNRPVDPARAIAMRDVIKHRGPDDSGLFTDRGVALGSRRLSIVDLSANGHMPMSTPDGRYTIAYNGEVYNYQDLRPALEAKGYSFRSNTDTEVLLYLYAEEGPDMLKRLNGMFGLAIWDARERVLFVARDRMGVKPVYYAIQEATLFFASEQKALFAAGIRAEFDSGTWEELMCFRYVAGERTPFRGVQRLLPGHYLRWQSGGLDITRWWNLSERAKELRANEPKDPVTWFQQTFDDSVNIRRICDVPVGVLLSGGLDSSCVAASLGAQNVKGAASFTVRFKEEFYDESPLARVIAKKSGLEYHDLIVDENELLDLVHKCSWLNDEPLAHANDPHLFAISRYAKPRVTVLLSGEGADELMGGYVRYQPLRNIRMLHAARPAVRALSALLPTGVAGTLSSRVHKMQRMLDLGGPDEFVLFDACDVFPSELGMLGFRCLDEFTVRRRILAEAQGLYPGEAMRQAMYLDQHTFLTSILDRNDRTTMGASIECRVPFLDYRIVEGIAALPSSVLLRGRQSKALLRSAFAHRLPPEILGHRKWGFAVPWHKYFRERPEFKAIIADLPTTKPIVDGPFDRAKLTRVVEDYLKGDIRYQALVRQLFFVAVWHKASVETVGRTRT